jgi:hypothetical protein
MNDNAAADSLEKISRALLDKASEIEPPRRRGLLARAILGTQREDEASVYRDLGHTIAQISDDIRYGGGRSVGWRARELQEKFREAIEAFPPPLPVVMYPTVGFGVSMVPPMLPVVTESPQAKAIKSYASQVSAVLGRAA